MTNFEAIKSMVQIKDVMNYYGIQTNRQGMALCPLHSERTPSFKIYKATNSFYCFGCGVGGDVIKLVELMENVTAADAAGMLDSIFNTGVCGARLNPELVKKQIRRKREMQALQKFKAWERKFINSLLGEQRKLEKDLKSLEVFSDEWVSAQNRFNEINDLLDIFMTNRDGYELYRAEIYKNGGKLHCLI